MFEIPVLINIFVSKQRISTLIEALSAVEPSRLYVFQDGAKTDIIKSKLDDALNYAKSLITWDCDIKTMRLKENHGPAEGEILAYKWMFSLEEKGIILEDDLVPNKSFFLYCREMLNLYENDERIAYIAGVNPYGTYHENQKDIFFSTRGPLCGWATWRRFIDILDLNYSSFSRSDYKKIMLSKCVDSFSLRQLNKKIKSLKINNRLDFEVIICLTTIFNNQLSIIPTKNLVMNCGVDAAAQNGASSLRLMPKIYQKNYFAQTYELSFPLRPNPIIKEEPRYRKRYNQPFYKRIYVISAVVLRRVLFGRRKNKDL